MFDALKYKKFNNISIKNVSLFLAYFGTLLVFTGINKLVYLSANPCESGFNTPFYLRGWALSIYWAVFGGLIVLYWHKRKRDFEVKRAELEDILNQRTAELIHEKEKTDELLANLLPQDTVEELKNTGKASSKKFEMVTVLFSDIHGFTKIVEEMNPEKLIDALDNFFFYFDTVVEKYNIEKIKTIGDAYMCAGGIPYKNRTNPVEVVLAALEVQEYMKKLKRQNNDVWDLRIGIHTGAVIAGVVGHKRMSYDIWGDTVNTASRMESSGVPGKVNISGHTYDMIKDFFICEYRGKMPVKYKGDVDMYFVKCIRPELSIDMNVIPNKAFFIQTQFLRLEDLEEHVMDKLENELPKSQYFHNIRYTSDIYTQAELIGRAEGITQEEMLVVRTAALLLNTGFTRTYEDYETASANYAREILPRFRYSKHQIEAVSNLIRSIKHPNLANNQTEAVFLDACFTYIGRVDFIDLSVSHYKETHLRAPFMTQQEWFLQELKFLENYPFHTVIAKLLRDVSTEEQRKKIKEFANLN